MANLVLLGLDIATRTGWCVGAPGGVPEYGAIVLKEPDEPEGAAFSKFRVWLEGAIEAYGVTDIFAESAYLPREQRAKKRWAAAGAPAPAASRGGPPVDLNVTKRLFGLRSISRMVAYENRIIYHKEFTPAKIANHFTGFALYGGRTEKKARTCEIAKLYGYDVGSDDDKADAIAIWHLGASIVSPYARPAGPLLIPASRPLAPAK